MSEIPFPLIARQKVQITSGGNPVFLEVTKQGIPKFYSAEYLILPGQQVTKQIPQIGNLNIFDVDKNHLVEWVSWIDNKYLGAAWTINGQIVNILEGSDSPLTYEISPKGSDNAPLFLFNAPNANVTYTLSNLSSVYPIRGRFEIVLYTYEVKELPAAPDIYTVASYSLSQAVSS